MTFDQFNFHSPISAAIEAQGFSEPTPIQAQAIPAALENKDLLGIAQTGTGKTAAFVLPMLERLMTGPRRKVRALIIAPTRELAMQIDEVIQALGKGTGLRSVLIFGGVAIQPQVRRLRSGVEIVVACPGRLLDHISRKTINLSQVEMLVLDEADHMFDMGFLPAIRKIVEYLPKKRQTLLFSATMPDDIRKLASKVLFEPVTVEVGRVAPPQTIEHAIYPVAHHQKSKLFLKLLRQTDYESVLVFTRTKHKARHLAQQLDKKGYNVASLQGNLSQNRRKAAMEGFRRGKYTILVATDIAARGLDISSISHVINYDVPSTAETYTHRIGRTGRAARSGEAFTFVTAEDTRVVRAIEKLLGKPLEQRRLQGFEYQEVSSEQQKEPRPSTRRPQRKPSGKSNWRTRRNNRGQGRSGRSNAPQRRGRAQR